ncbi:hypothetical protein BCR43DRAFT_510410 [Syncephalastrum racemosum]|uniref:Uncharacterized protein n=1 Tax=Syncephalastrum racemosum TaxID=13706 RepID=A0A1X2HUR7_SYNRA|nr:hypothetical protein BCR43DRAFT_510410 [Syncephalastrum racemosum]
MTFSRTFKRRKNAVDTFHEEAISTLTTAAQPAAREVRRLVDSNVPNKELIQDTIDGRHDARNNTGLPLDSPTAEILRTSDTSTPSQSLLQLRAPGRDGLQIDNYQDVILQADRDEQPGSNSTCFDVVAAL